MPGRISLPGRFELIAEIGRGGTGVVYEAIDRVNGGHVAIKTLFAPKPELIARFKREFRALADIHHPNLVTLGELFCEEGQWCFSMDLVDGVDFVVYARSSARRRDAPTADAGSGESASAGAGGYGWSAGYPVGGDGRCDHGRLREALIQLVRGLDALHAANRVHRDVKPSNVLVRSDGHVYILDFGLVRDLGGDDFVTGHLGLLGTPAYMAPEQVDNVPRSESDLYAVGVVVFEALTGRLPFDGSPLHQLAAKADRPAPSAKSLSPDVPDDLNALTSALLATRPADRPRAADVIHALRRDSGARPGVRHATPILETHACIGRDAELAQLGLAFDATLQGKAQCVLVAGESGVGKSFLVQHFLSRVRADDPDAVLLSGRCYEKESVPFKAFDGVIDALVRHLTRVQIAQPIDALLPTQLSPLVQTFPVLLALEAVGRATRELRPRVDPLEVRSRAFGALRDMFERMAQRAPLVVTIDDMQWSDEDSMGLLAELVREPAPPPLLLIMTARLTPSEQRVPPSRFDSRLFSTGRRTDVDTPIGGRFRSMLPGGTPLVSLTRLPEAEAEELARDLLARFAPARTDEARAIACEAEGHPMFIDALVRHVGRVPGGDRTNQRLEDVLTARMADLDPEARRFLTLSCLAGVPMPVMVLAQAAGVDVGLVSSVVADLRARRLARSATVQGVESVEPYHDRIRSAAVHRMAEAERQAGYGDLARALDGTAQGMPHVLAEFWWGAGDKERAGRRALEAAERAVRALAFGRAATLYRGALKRPSITDAERHHIHGALGEALSQAGRAEEAAYAFQVAAKSAVNPDVSLDLKRRAAEQLLRVGRLEAGIEAVRELLSQVGLRWPRSPMTAVLSLLWLRAWRAVFGYRFARRDSATLSRRERLRLDICWTVAMALATCDYVRAAVFQQRHLRLALRSGDARRVACSLALECAFHAERGEVTWPSTRRRIDRAIAMADEVGDPFCVGLARVLAGTAAHLCGRFREAWRDLDRGQDQLRSECPGATFEIATAQFLVLSSLAWLGEVRVLLERQPVYLREATERGDTYGIVVMCIGDANLAWLLLDQPQIARDRAQEAAERSALDGYYVEQAEVFLALGRADLYVGDLGALRQRMDTEWPRLERSRLLRRIELVRVASAHLRARAALAEAESIPANRVQALCEAERIARALRREPSTGALALAPLVMAGAAQVRGDDVSAVEHLRASVEALQRADASLHLAVARRYLGKLVAGDEGAALVAKAEGWLSAEGVRNLPAMSRCIVPGFGRVD